MAGGAVAVTLTARVDLRVPAEESLHGRAHLRLKADRHEDQHSLEGVYQVGDVPDVLRPADRPGDHVRHPGDTHHDHQFHAYAAERRPESREARISQVRGTRRGVFERGGECIAIDKTPLTDTGAWNLILSIK